MSEEEAWLRMFDNLMSEGERSFDASEYEAARRCFQFAQRSIPEDRRDSHQYSQTMGAKADCFFSLEEYESTLLVLDELLLRPTGPHTPHVEMRRGQVLIELGKAEEAIPALISAYSNGGAEVFQGEDETWDLIADIAADDVEVAYYLRR